jgi:hypothetical protein
MRQAARQVAAALSAQPRYAAGISAPLSAGGQSLVSKDGRSALVTFEVPGNVADVDQTAATDARAVATVQARHPDLLIAESGEASLQQAIDNATNFGSAGPSWQRRWTLGRSTWTPSGEPPFIRRVFEDSARGRNGPAPGGRRAGRGCGRPPRPRHPRRSG